MKLWEMDAKSMKQEKQMYRVSGCGISAICEKGESMVWIMERIIQKGGVPKVERLSAGESQ